MMSSQLLRCPCGLDQRQLELYENVDKISLRCTAEHADGSDQIYGHLLGAHRISLDTQIGSDKLTNIILIKYIYICLYSENYCTS